MGRRNAEEIQADHRNTRHDGAAPFGEELVSDAQRVGLGEFAGGGLKLLGILVALWIIATLLDVVH
ncbi:hypothetical protein AB0G86_05890 [Streptomyces scabiei]|uniref:hypothetical protein n=1 Tax=Streptomyces scabiei TaxID=1930 RepID=UPI0033F01BC5